jgi:hypothetical protein
MDHAAVLRANIELAAARALGEQDASPHSTTSGCFDRRYWAWKLVDFPEATFQRLVWPLAQLYRDPQSRFHAQPEVLAAVRSGLACASRLQHANGSFDQAFPFEQSYGATAFLVYPLLEAARLVDEHLTAGERASAERMTRRGAEFLCAHEETHGEISNHLAGAALSLVAAADRFGEARYEAAANRIVDGLLARQSPEGWFPEYGGADPGYQTLCLDYLAAVAERRPSDRLSAALDRSLEFLKWFVHPDGSLGGVYGSRRTSLAYLGGLARMAPANPTAAAIRDVVGHAIANGDLAGPATMDAGNLAPMLTSTITAMLRPPIKGGPTGTSVGNASAALPHATPGASADFPLAGLYVRSGAEFYAICGAANGGTVTVFSRTTKRVLLDDGGYVAETSDGHRLTTQAAGVTRVAGDAIEIAVPFVRMPSAVPTPGRFLVLRLLNLTVMRSIAIGNWVKARLVALLMAGGAPSDLRLTRRVTCDDQGVTIHDRIENPGARQLAAMTGGRPFSAIHMASAGYFHGARLGTARPPVVVDVDRLARDRFVEVSTHV